MATKTGHGLAGCGYRGCKGLLCACDMVLSDATKDAAFKRYREHAERRRVLREAKKSSSSVR